jgi:hypothetical protein
VIYLSSLLLGFCNLGLSVYLYAILLHKECSTYDLLTLGILTLTYMRYIPNAVPIRYGNTTLEPKTVILD